METVIQEVPSSYSIEEEAKTKSAPVADGGDSVSDTAGAQEQRSAAYAEDLRVALLGNVDSGKTSLTGVLSKGTLDDGRGHARSFVLQHRHEHEKGQTSSVALELLGFSEGEQVLPSKVTGRHNKDFYDVATRSSHRMMLVDLCGHEKYLRTTIFGLTGMLPNLALLVVAANNGVLKMTREHLGLSCALQIPVAVVVTKIDMCPPNIHKESMQKIDRILKLAKKKKYLMKNEDDVKVAVQGIASGKVTPVFQVSNVSGEGLPLLKSFLKQLAVRGIRSHDDDPETSAVEFHLDNVYVVQGVGTVVGGTLQEGAIRPGQKLMLGPDKLANYRPVVVRSIHRQCVPTDVLYPGQQATLAVKPAAKSKEGALKRNAFRKGMVLVSEGQELTCWEFDASVKVLHHSTTIMAGYAPVVHMGVVRQAARIVSIKDEEDGSACLRTGSQAVVRFRFLYFPEFLGLGRRMIFREGRAKGVGQIIRLIKVGSTEEIGQHVNLHKSKAGSSIHGATTNNQDGDVVLVDSTTSGGRSRVNTEDSVVSNVVSTEVEAAGLPDAMVAPSPPST